MNQYTKKPLKSVRFSRVRQEQMFATIDRQTRERNSDSNRRTTRVPLTFLDEILVVLSHPNGSLVSFAVPPRNLSERGLAFLHGGYVYPQSACCVVLPRKDGKHDRLYGRIRDCRHVDGVIHEVALVFLDPIRLEDYVTIAPEPSSATTT